MWSPLAIAIWNYLCKKFLHSDRIEIPPTSMLALYCYELLLSCLGPTAAPRSFTVTVQSSRSLLLHWTPPPVRNRGGAIQGYKIIIVEAETRRQLQYNTAGLNATSYRATMLRPYHNYQCRVAAYNSAGMGRYTRAVTRITLQDGKL